MDTITRILVTGTEGYLAALLAPELIHQGYEVIGLDTGFYKGRTLYQDGGTTPLTLAKDLRHVGAEDLKDVDAVVPLAELPNDPAGQLAPPIYLRNQPQETGSFPPNLSLRRDYRKRRRNTLRFFVLGGTALELHRHAKAPTDHCL
jgi:hypothetical protein